LRMSPPPKCWLVLAALLLPACVATGTKINDRSLTSKIVAEKSTRSDVVALLGLPERVSYGQAEEETWQYFQVTEIPKATGYLPLIRAFADGFDWQTQKLVITFDKQGVVKSLERQEQSVGKESVPY
jgi:outer membrane protein assembly factor BamE (lipoprotein component of BamABCDE complex)